MEFGSSTLLIFLFLSPALCAYMGVRAGSPFDIKLDTKSQITQILILIVLAVVLHILLVPFYIFLLQGLISSFNRENLVAEFSLLNFDYKNWAIISGYVLLSYFLGFAFGYIFIQLIEKGVVKVKSFHGFMYPFVTGNANKVIYCSIFTQTNHDNFFLLYKGRLDEVSFQNKNQIDVISIRNPERYILKITQAGATQIYKSKKVSYFSSVNNDNCNESLIINGDQIANILFTDTLSGLELEL